MTFKGKGGGEVKDPCLVIYRVGEGKYKRVRKATKRDDFGGEGRGRVTEGG